MADEVTGKYIRFCIAAFTTASVGLQIGIVPPVDREAIDDQIRNILQKLEDAGVSEAIGLTEELRRFLRMRQEELRQKALDLPDVENGTSGSKENS